MWTADGPLGFLEGHYAYGAQSARVAPVTGERIADRLGQASKCKAFTVSIHPVVPREESAWTQEDPHG